MFQRIHLNSIEDYFLPPLERQGQGVYFSRLTVYNEELQKQIQRYLEETMQFGVCVEGKISNPEGKQLSYYQEMMGMDYELNRDFFKKSLGKWLPRVPEDKQEIVADSFYDILYGMAQKGKNENMQKNAYIKYMCWLYYKFERLLAKTPGNTRVPKLLYQGYPNEYELSFLSILSKAGCDILLLLVQGEEEYRKVDFNSVYSEQLQVDGTAFPEGFSILKQSQELMQKLREPKAPEISTEKIINTNTWIQGNIYEDVACPLETRGTDSRFFYNVFAGIYGAEQPGNYYSKLLQWKMKLEKDTAVYLIEEHIKKAQYEEVQKIQRKQYETPASLINHMMTQIVCVDKKAEAYAKASFVRVLKQETEKPMNKLINYGVELVCIVNRYLSQMFGNVGTTGKVKKLLLFYGEVGTETERMFLEIMAGLPMDVVLINPEGKAGKNIKSELFFDKIFENNIPKEKFPTDIKDMQFETVAYQAEQEIGQVLYQDTGMYRNQQFTKAVPVVLSNTYEEIGILWDQEAKYRPNFQILDDRVIVPVIFAKVSGVPGGNVTEYWEGIAKLYSPEVFLIKEFPYLANRQNPWREKSYQFLSRGKLLKDAIKAHSEYPFGFIRDSMQDYMLEKLQEIIDSKSIQGTGQDGTENLIVSTILQMDTGIIRLIQKYDFTKQIPKILVLHTKESRAVKEDAILLAYLSLIGFDIVVYAPTGYNGVERFYTKPLMTEYQVGEYKYDLKIPNLSSVKRSSESFMGRLFRRGR